MLSIIGIALYGIWLLLIILKYNKMPKNRNFSYKTTLFGDLLWYKNLRNILLIIASFTLLFFANLKTFYLLLLITTLLLLYLSIRNFRFKIGLPGVSLIICVVSLLTSIGSAYLLFKM
ncbi:hypothetical protein IV53_GL000725 [Ligilactobacillus ceti DSM 22408]|uniref:Uncharacterized protein n=1 Tax=Ligilactobacillus ceti DSM 22408 TaxID=1122146 RepID=A0A0R2KMT5_9LACO|nr:hypothetical protein IV53_GL000725 [Ligilactobacillus ceti DSM 22408]